MCLSLLGLSLDFLCIWELGTTPFCENYAKLYFDAKYLEKRVSRGGEIFVALFLKKCHLWPISDATALVFYIRSCLCVGTLCQTLSKALINLGNILQTSQDRLASKVAKICVITISWCIQESPCLKPDWLTLSRQLWSKKS